MTNCPLNRNANGYLECPDCHWIYKGKAEFPHRNCPNSPDLTEARERLGISVDDMKHWAQALARWTRAGFPVRSQSDIERCMRICVKCKDFLPDKPLCTDACQLKTGGRCRRCGCRVSKSSFAVANKIRMATEECENWVPPTPEA